MSSSFRAALAAAVFAAFLGAGSLLAHEGHDHDAPAPATIANLAPRAEAVSELYELVAIVRAGELVIYLDRFATNETVDGATIEVETPAGPETARSAANEPYRLNAPWSGKPGSYDLIFTVTSDGNADVLPATLIIPPEDPAGKSGTAAMSNSAGGSPEPAGRRCRRR